MEEIGSLFEFIKSLSKSEKRYFRLHSELQKGSKQYLKLFDAIEKQKTYDEESLKRLFPEDKAKLAYNKNYLQKMLFKSLEAYYSENSIDARIQKSIIKCKILFNKSFYREYFNAIKQAKKLALKYERFGYFMEILEMEKMFTPKQDIKLSQHDRLCDEAVEIIEKLSNSYQYSRIIRELFAIFRNTGASRIKGHEELLSSISKGELMNDPAHAKSSKALMTYYRITEYISKMKADHEEVLNSAVMQLRIIKEDPFPFEDFIIDFRFDAMHAAISSFIKLGRTVEAERIIKELEEIKMVTPSDRVGNEIGIAYYQLEIYLKTGNLKELATAVPKTEQLLLVYKDKIEADQEMMLHFKIICAHILTEDFQKALAKSNYLLVHPLLAARKDIESYTRILTLIIHFEIKNFDLLPYLIRSTYHFLLKSEKLFKLEYLVISFLKKLTHVLNEDELNFRLLQLQREMKNLKNDKFERNAFEYFDFSGWIEKKIRQKHVKIR